MLTFQWLICDGFELCGADDINEDRMIALRKRAEVDSKYLVIYTPSDALEPKQSLNRHVYIMLTLLSETFE